MSTTRGTRGKRQPKLKRGLNHIPIKYNHEPHSHKVLVGIPSTGRVRFEWARSMMFTSKPTNWAHAMCSPIGFQVAEARNEVVQVALQGGFDWIFFIDHDVLMPENIFFMMRRHMTENTKPVVSGLYYMKSDYAPEPLVYRGRTNGPFYDWKHGDKFWVDGIPMGCALIHTSLFRAMKPPYFVTPSVYEETVTADGHQAGGKLFGGTEDLYWCGRVLDEGIIEKAGWKVPDPKNPFWMDTSIFCQHISIDTGKQYPSCTGDDWMVNHKAARASYRRARRQKVAAEA